MRTKDNHHFIARRVAEQARLFWQGLLTISTWPALMKNAVNAAAEVLNSRRELSESGKKPVNNVLGAGG